MQLLSQQREFLRHSPGVIHAGSVRIFRSGLSQAVLLPSYFSLFQQGPFAPSALPDFLATTGLSDSRSGPLAVMYFRPRALRISTSLPDRVSQVPRLICPCALPPLTPGSPATACAHCFI